MKAAREYKKGLLKHLKNSKATIAYLNAALEDDDLRVFLIALRDVAEAHMNISKLARQSALQRESFYKITSQKGNPSLSNVLNIIRTLGLKIKIEKSAKLAA
jgi:probable addiction module antidote protein